jgi:hypothetical protein
MELEEGFNFLKLPNTGGVLVDSKSYHQKWIRKIKMKTANTTDLRNI